MNKCGQKPGPPRGHRVKRSRRSSRKSENLKGDDPGLVEAFETEYTRIEREHGLAAAKAYYRENFMVSCFACGHMGKTVPPLNCARCGTYLD